MTGMAVGCHQLAGVLVHCAAATAVSVQRLDAVGGILPCYEAQRPRSPGTRNTEVLARILLTHLLLCLEARKSMAWFTGGKVLKSFS